jgi:hypothetical protein
MEQEFITAAGNNSNSKNMTGVASFFPFQGPNRHSDFCHQWMKRRHESALCGSCTEAFGGQSFGS